MNSASSQNLLDQGYALFDRDMLPLEHVTNFIGHFYCAFIVGHEQGEQDRFEIVNSAHPDAGLKSGVASNPIYEIVNGVSFFDHALRLYEAPPVGEHLRIACRPRNRGVVSVLSISR
jgi:hypothetical protein